MFRVLDIRKIKFPCQFKLIQTWAKLEECNAEKSKFQREWANAKPFENIPSLKRFEMIRSFLPGGKFYGKSLIEFHRSLRNEYGNIISLPAMLGRPQMITVFDVEDFKKVFRFEGQFPLRMGLETLQHYRDKIRPDIYGEFGSVTTSHAERWYKTRTLVNPVMMKPTTIKLYVPQVNEIAREFIEMIMKLRDGRNEVPANFCKYLNRWSLETVTFITLNRRLGILSEDNKDENATKLLQLITEYFVTAYDFDIQPSIWRYYETKAFKRLISVLDEMTNITMDYVEKSIEDLRSQQPKREHVESILEKLVKIDKRLAVTLCIDNMIAGADTTASAAVGILFCLAKNQDKQGKLREELRRILPNENDNLTPEKMLNMPYLRSVIKEGIRMYPPVIGTLRTSKDDLVLSGYRVPKGSEVLLSWMISYKDEKHFAQGQEFIPERWFKKSAEQGCPNLKLTATKNSNPFAYLPFGFGPRMCLGKRIAELEMEVLLIRLVRDYRVEWNHPDLKIRSVVINIPDGDLKFKFTKLKND